jgi:ribonuclease P protein component
VGGAVERNRVKRRLRERLRLHLKEARLRSGLDVVIIARAPARDADYQTLGRALDDLLERAGLWKRGK